MKFKNLYLTLFIALSLLILIPGSFFIVQTQNLMRTHYNDRLDSENLRVRSIMHNLTNHIQFISNEIINDSNLLTMLSTTYENEQHFIYDFRQFISHMNRQSLAPTARTFIYTSNPFIIEMYDSHHALTLLPISSVSSGGGEWLEKALTQFSPFWVVLPIIDASGHIFHELNLIRQIPIHASRDIAVLRIPINNNHVRNQIFNSSSPLFISLSLDGYTDFLHADFFENINRPDENSSHNLEIIRQLNLYGSEQNLFIKTIDSDATTSIRRIIFTGLGITFSSLIILMLMILYFRKIKKSRDIEAFLFKSKLDEQKLQIYKHQMEFKALAGQINSHFLFNTLETIRMQAITGGSTKVAKSIVLLSKSLRHYSRNHQGETTTLKDELYHIEIYNAIQSMRFGESRISYKLEVLDGIDTNRVSILPLLLQPIVENAMLHGLYEKEKDGCITMTISKSQKNLFIEIFDNGVGIEPEKLQMLRENLSQPSEKNANFHNSADNFHGIALHIVSQKIKMHYGADSSLRIDSSINTGTTVTLTLPWKDE